MLLLFVFHIISWPLHYLTSQDNYTKLTESLTSVSFCCSDSCLGVLIRPGVSASSRLGIRMLSDFRFVSIVGSAGWTYLKYKCKKINYRY